MKKRSLTPSGGVTLFLPIIFIYIFSTWPSYEFYKPDESQLLLSLKRRTEKVKVCTEEERMAMHEAQTEMLSHMRSTSGECGTRARAPLEIKIWLDGKESVSKVIKPAGIHSDGVVFVFEKFTFKSGPHDIRITMRDFKEGPDVKTYEFNEHLEFKPRKIILVTYSPEADSLFIHK